MPAEILIPVEGCWVRRVDRDGLAHVVGHRSVSGQYQMQVASGPDDLEWVPLASLKSGFQVDWTVQDIPISATRKSLGEGRIVAKREIGDREQLLVQLDSDGRSVWLPFQRLRRIKDVGMRYTRAETGCRDHAERLRLRLLAHALENWNMLTGALDRLDVDPLPHQIQLVHRILSSGNHNWLIADDVGLGKTIEVGLLLAALKRRGQARRVLIVTPAGLVRQWQDEMLYKFDQSYQIYGYDFAIKKPEHWKLYDHVIVSIDLAKRESHLKLFQQAGGWDVVTFDEGHKLTRYASGERADRYRLAEVLRPVADTFIVLSGTPHQGYTDRFKSLLELIRPDLRRQIHMLEANPEIVGELILRNRKSEVTTADGELIFKGQVIHRIPVEPSPETQEFQRLLRDYLRRGYKAGELAGAPGRAIGFVMTTYRKLASSSIAAIERALRLRLERLLKQDAESPVAAPGEEFSLESLSEGGDEQDDLTSTISGTSPNEFFELERELIGRVLASASHVRETDEKLRIFLENVVDPLVLENKKLLVFTEYRATQSYLQEALRQRYVHLPEAALINGSMKLDEKLTAIKEFNDFAPFLISTEAGGEGLNLHSSCHILVNYDLPWNPARLVQRIGRLYRYGQSHPVIVFNLHARDSFDNSAIDLMLQRVSQIVRDMAPVGREFHDRLHAEIIGEILENVDLSQVLRASTDMVMERTTEQIEAALRQARLARQMQEEIFSYALGYDQAAMEGALGFTMRHVDVFVTTLLPLLGIKIERRLYDGGIFEVRLPDQLKGRFVEFGQRSIVRLTTSRRIAQQNKDVVLLDFETDFFRFLIEQAKSQKFDGIYAAAAAPVPLEGVLAAFKLRWQNDQGDVILDEFTTFLLNDDETVVQNPPSLADWLCSPLASADPPGRDRQARHLAFGRLLAEAHRQLSSGSTRFKHPNGIVALAAADCTTLAVRAEGHPG